MIIFYDLTVRLVLRENTCSQSALTELSHVIFDLDQSHCCFPWNTSHVNLLCNNKKKKSLLVDWKVREICVVAPPIKLRRLIARIVVLRHANSVALSHFSARNEQELCARGFVRSSDWLCFLCAKHTFPSERITSSAVAVFAAKWKLHLCQLRVKRIRFSTLDISRSLTEVKGFVGFNFSCSDIL